jgi:hypothetical protein
MSQRAADEMRVPQPKGVLPSTCVRVAKTTRKFGVYRLAPFAWKIAGILDRSFRLRVPETAT